MPCDAGMVRCPSTYGLVVSDHQAMPQQNRYREAFKESYNILGVAGLVAASAALLNPVVLLGGLVAETVYLLFVPDTKWYEKRLSKRYDAEVNRHRQELKDRILPTLRPSMQQRFARLEQTRKDIEAHPVEEGDWFREVLRKLDFLLEKFLLFASKDAEYRSYLRTVLAESRGTSPAAVNRGFDIPDNERRQNKQKPRQNGDRLPEYRDNFGSGGPALSEDAMITEIEQSYEREIAKVKTQAEKEADDDTKAVLEKRLDVLTRRREFIGKVDKIITNLSNQLKLLEDTFGLINDEIRARSPEQVLADIDDVVTQTNTMTEVLEELAPYEQMAARLGV